MAKRIDASKMELKEKVVEVNRVTKTVKGGRNMRFAVTVAIGDEKGHVGVGSGKAAEIPDAMRKASDDAKKHLIEVPLNKNASIYYQVEGKAVTSRVMLKPAPEGTGVIAGGSARAVIELAGIRNIRTKSLGSNNKKNVCAATINALQQLRRPEEIAEKRGKKLEEIL